jgi:solute carrier family 25 carnitine/acylcarnitine transporter 20/29
MYYPIVTIPLVNAVSFSSYELYKRLFGQAGDLSFSNGLKAGAFSGVIGSLIVNPVELIKCRMQADHGKYQSSAECLHQVLRNQGLKELYRGMFSTLARELPSMGGQFAAYEIAKDHFLGKKTAKTLTFQESFITGGIAGIGAWVFAYPQDVVKTRLQVHNKEYKKAKWLPDGGFLDCWREIYRENGVKGFFRGILPCFMRAFIANGFMIVAY